MGLWKSASKLGAFIILGACIVFALRTPADALALMQLGVASFVILVLQKTGFEAAKVIFTKGQNNA